MARDGGQEIAMAPTEVVELASELIAIDTTNSGSTVIGEQLAAECVADRLVEAGGRPELLAAAAGRDNVLLRIDGTDRDLPGIVVHGHLDTVAADPDEWTVDPWSGLERDGCLWGRGAIDMKGSDAVMLAVARHWLDVGERPRRDVVFGWLADEEAGGTLGARWLLERHPDRFAGCRVAVGEIGGFGVPLGGGRTLYPLMTAERARARLDLSVRGRSRHSSISRGGDPVSTLARCLIALTDHEVDPAAAVAVDGLLQVLGPLCGMDLAKLPLPAALTALGPLAALVEPAIRHSMVPTMLTAGSAPNMVPGKASAVVDCRILPGRQAEFGADVERLIDGRAEHALTTLSEGFQAPFDHPVVAAMTEALRRADPGAITAPYLVSAATDAAHFAAAGMLTYGFTPLGLPIGFPLGTLFHGVDERVPIAGLRFGVQVLDDFLRTV